MDIVENDKCFNIAKRKLLNLMHTDDDMKDLTLADAYAMAAYVSASYISGTYLSVEGNSDKATADEWLSSVALMLSQISPDMNISIVRKEDE